MARDKFLLHSLLDLEPVVSNIVRAARPRNVLEIGVGEFSKTLLDVCRDVGASLTSVDPKPSFLHIGTHATTSEEFFKAPLGEAPDAVEPFDLVVIDGDHNYHTVSMELREVFGRNPSAVAILHDTGWPCGRRDFYYDPSRIPEDALHPHSWVYGAVPGQQELVPWGFRGEGAFAIALHEGGPKNGVMTAVDDFIAESLETPLRCWWSTPSVFGLTLLVGRGAFGGETRAGVTHDFKFSPDEVLERLERNRLDLYAEVLRLHYGERA